MSVPVVKRLMKHYYSGSVSGLYYLRQEAGSSRLHTEQDLANNIQEISALSASDVTHTTRILMSELRKVLVRGDRVRIDGLGTFFMTLSCMGVQTEEECNVRNIRRVNIRFLPDKSLKLVNNALAVTRSENNVSFFIKDADAASSAGDPGGGSGNGGGDDFVDPDA